jgi:hypothetical protein
MSPQEHATHLLEVWQSRRHLKPICRLVHVDAPSIVPEPDADEYEHDLDVLRSVMERS